MCRLFCNVGLEPIRGLYIAHFGHNYFYSQEIVIVRLKLSRFPLKQRRGKEMYKTPVFGGFFSNLCCYVS